MSTGRRQEPPGNRKDDHHVHQHHHHRGQRHPRRGAPHHPIRQEGTITFGIANNQRFGDTEKTNFVDCSLWGDRAEKLAPYIKKGTGLLLQGSLDYREWERDGQKRSKLELHVDKLSFKGGRKADDEAEDKPAPEIAGDLYDDDIPF